jgi:dienelactone hydrolase
MICGMQVHVGPTVRPNRNASRRVILVTVAAALLVAWVGCLRSEEAALSFKAENIGGPRSNQAGELFVPNGSGPFPAVIVLYGCNGVTPHARWWARRMVSWGYAALVIDSFRPRGIVNICNNGTLLQPALRASDAFAGAAYLATLASVDAARLALIGFSHGGVSALLAAQRSPPAGSVRFQAIVAYYPWCPAEPRPLATDLLILIGDADDWTPAQRCIDVVARYGDAAHRPILTVYSGATHSFDAPLPDRTYFGHRLAHDVAAARDAADMTHRFFAGRIRR